MTGNPRQVEFDQYRFHSASSNEKAGRSQGIGGAGGLFYNKNVQGRSCHTFEHDPNMENRKFSTKNKGV